MLTRHNKLFKHPELLYPYGHDAALRELVLGPKFFPDLSCFVANYSSLELCGTKGTTKLANLDINLWHDHDVTQRKKAAIELLEHQRITKAVFRKTNAETLQYIDGDILACLIPHVQILKLQLPNMHLMLPIVTKFRHLRIMHIFHFKIKIQDLVKIFNLNPELSELGLNIGYVTNNGKPQQELQMFFLHPVMRCLQRLVLQGAGQYVHLWTKFVAESESLTFLHLDMAYPDFITASLECDALVTLHLTNTLFDTNAILKSMSIARNLRCLVVTDNTCPYLRPVDIFALVMHTPNLSCLMVDFHERSTLSPDEMQQILSLREIKILRLGQVAIADMIPVLVQKGYVPWMAFECEDISEADLHALLDVMPELVFFGKAGSDIMKVREQNFQQKYFSGLKHIAARVYLSHNFLIPDNIPTELQTYLRIHLHSNITPQEALYLV